MALTPLEDFVRTSVSGIGLLLLGTLAAVVLANSPLADGYEAFWNANLTIGTAGFGITESLRHWVNDALMALFFFIVGLEIKREVLVGEMRYPRQAALAISAAVGGVAVPALIFALINRDGAGLHGWGIPMATDTAFALGILALLGSRVRPMLLVFLTAFAIVDDLLAVGVIAIFYTETISWGALAIAGVLVALTVPARSWINPSEFLLRSRQLIDDFEAACFVAPSILTNEPQQQATQSLARLAEDVETPMTYFQHRLNPWVAYGILPIFAFANAGIPLVSGLGAALANPVAWGVVAGLVIGKPLGIILFAWLAVRLGIASLPRAITWPHVLGVGWLGGIGFTISLFVTELAFEAGQLADVARVGILFGSVIAGVFGYLVLRQSLPPPRDEAEG
ncbi:MAG: Na+/H+ antiporter NhaA [Chloroflexia bacterium]|nr:Na+/H+ antiporter NhaA [Chloroflexia bacterium]